MQERWQTLRSELFPTTVLLALSDQRLAVQRLPGRGETLPEALLVPIPAATCRDGRPLQVEALGDFIGDLLLGEGQIAAQLRVALPAVVTQWRVLDSPWLHWPEDPAAALRALEPDLGLSFPLEQADLDLMPLEATVPQALVAAVERQVLSAWLEVFAIAGVRLERVVPSQVALTAALQQRLLAADAEVLVALLHPEAQALRLLVWRAGVPLYERVLVGPPDRQVEELERCLAFLHWHLQLSPTVTSEIWLDGAMEPEARGGLEALLALPLEVLEADGYGNLVLQGLARLEVHR